MIRDSHKDVSALWFFTVVENRSLVTARLQCVCLKALYAVYPLVQVPGWLLRRPHPGIR